ncbi:cold shock domain-containing protein [Amycolatopsis sp. lyj-112]|uniref:cold shock domain-containing protein n=1 Tax=Amycolatopsis sp. lyj-112 TaxID=2789288 RepID=UPI00397ABEC7
MGHSDGRTYRGFVRLWHVDDGWGVVESPSFADPIWVHYSTVSEDSRGILADGFLQLFVGDEVEITVEHAEQDEFHLRALWVRSIGGNRDEKSSNR